MHMLELIVSADREVTVPAAELARLPWCPASLMNGLADLLTGGAA